MSESIVDGTWQGSPEDFDDLVKTRLVQCRSWDASLPSTYPKPFTDMRIVPLIEYMHKELRDLRMTCNFQEQLLEALSGSETK